MSDALVSQVDLLATFATLTGQKLAAEEAPDSFDVLSALLGKSKSGRSQLVEHSGVIALREGAWKYIEPSKGQKRLVNTNTETGNDPQPQLYNLASDPGETNNVAAVETARTESMAAALKQMRDTGRTRQ